MGSDDIFKRKQAERQAEQKRKSFSRSSFDRILIVTEGSKTEPYYFSAIRDYLRLTSANIEIIGKGKAPITIVEHAQQMYKAERDNQFDKIYCVFDRDSHASFNEALEEINKFNRRAKAEIFVAIISNPSFEFWYLLHFKNTDAPYNSTQRKSVSDLVEEALMVELPLYSKNRKDMFDITFKELGKAIMRSKRIWANAIATGDMNPSTNVHELVEYLFKMKNRDI